MPLLRVPDYATVRLAAVLTAIGPWICPRRVPTTSTWLPDCATVRLGRGADGSWCLDLSEAGAQHLYHCTMGSGAEAIGHGRPKPLDAARLHQHEAVGGGMLRVQHHWRDDDNDTAKVPAPEATTNGAAASTTTAMRAGG